MIIETQFYKLILNDKTGSLESLHNGKKEFIEEGAGNVPLFTLRLRPSLGDPIEINAFEANSIRYTVDKNKAMNLVSIHYNTIAGMAIDVDVTVTCFQDNPMIYWNLAVNNDTDAYLEWVVFPGVLVPNDLVATGGGSKLLWPAMEGTLIEDVDLREKNDWLRYKPMEYPSRGWEGYYPGPCPTQFMAYYSDFGGMYLGAHDKEWNIKSIEFYKHAGGIQLEFKLYPEAAKAHYKMNYEMVLSLFDGDWHDAAHIYREWWEKTIDQKPLKLVENYKLPEWLKNSPVVVTYPVRGTKDTGEMSPNEYFPYINAIPYIEQLSKDFDSQILVLLMHWEGTAPWAPPYVWPPLGGTGSLEAFIAELHAGGNLLGLYASGIAWTNESNLLPEYNRKQQFDEEHLVDVMCKSPKGELPYSQICNGPIRWGYDMCPAHPFVEETVVEEVSKIIESGCDYLQYFDQNLGGISYLCYSPDHGHPPGPGKWQVEAMGNLYHKLQKIIEQSGKQVVLGCEAAAAEPFINQLPLNDLRYNINFFIGKPVPLYAYLFHEYVNNFMGNQNCAATAIDVQASPDNILYRLAYSFAAGDMSTVVLKSGGNIHWDWGTDWDVPAPDQQKVRLLIKNLNAWRKGIAQPFLQFGKMLKPHALGSIKEINIALRSGGFLRMPSLLTTRWSSPQGGEAQFVINYLAEPQSFRIQSEDLKRKEVQYYESADGTACLNRVSTQEASFSIPPLSARLIVF